MNDIREKRKGKTYKNIKFNFSFFLECNQEGRITVRESIDEFIQSKNWATSKLEWEFEFINS